MNKFVLGIIGLGLVSNLFALDATDIEAKIQEIQKLPANERVEKMNELKMEIRNMNENEREKVILAIKEAQEKVHNEINNHQEKMMQHTQQMHQMRDNEHETPDVEHEMPEVEHEMPEIEHETPDIEHDIDVDHTTEIEH